MKKLHVLILALLTLVFVMAAWWLQRPPETPTIEGTALNPDLGDRLVDVRQVEVRIAGDSFTVARQDGRWGIVEKSGYPANTDSLRQQLSGIAGLKIVQKKTANPDRFGNLNLQDITTEGSKAIQVIFKDGEGSVLLDLLFGSQKNARAGSSETEFYVRPSQGTQSWLVQGDLLLPRSIDDVIDRRIIKIDTTRVARVQVDHPDGTTVQVRRPSRDSADFQLQHVPAGFEINHQFSINDVANYPATLELKDVEPVAAAEERSFTHLLKMLTYDGLAIEMQFFNRNDTTWMELAARFDAGQVSEVVRAAERSGGTARGTAAASDDAEILKDEAAVRQEVALFNARWKGWHYQLPQFRLDGILKSFSELASETGSEPETATPDTPKSIITQ